MVKWLKENFSILDGMRAPSNASTFNNCGFSRKVVAWKPLSNGCFKFNVDKTTRGGLGESSIGRALRDEGGRVKILFSKSIGVGDLNRVEILMTK